MITAGCKVRLKDSGKEIGTVEFTDGYMALVHVVNSAVPMQVSLLEEMPVVELPALGISVSDSLAVGDKVGG